jgi:hypothetical protein
MLSPLALTAGSACEAANTATTGRRKRGVALSCQRASQLACAGQSAARHRQRNISRGRPATPVAGRHRRQLINQREDVVEGKRRGPVGHEEKGLRAGQVIELFMGMTAGRQCVLLVYSTCPMLQPVRDAVYPQFTISLTLRLQPAARLTDEYRGKRELK